MPIARSAFSCASAWEGDQARETKRSHGGKRGWFPLDNKRVSPSKANPFRPRYANCRSINLPKVVKSATVGDEMCIDTHWIDRGGWGERTLKEQRQVLGDLPWITAQTHMSVNNGGWESITADQPWKKSVRPVGAEKWGNAHGAKGPSFSHVSIKIKRSA
jgi:hypothetical protein